MYDDRLYRSEPSSTVQKQNVEKSERKGMYLPSQGFDPFSSSGFYSTPPEMTSLEKKFQDMGKNPLKYGLSGGISTFENYTSPDYSRGANATSTVPVQMMEDDQKKISIRRPRWTVHS